MDNRDIVEVLRSISSEVVTSSGEAGEILLSDAEKAAATIETLRAEVKAWRAWRKLVVRYMTAEIPDPTTKIEALKSAMTATDATGALGKEANMDRFDEMAVALVNKWLLGNEPAKIADIAAALRAAASVPEGYVRVGTTDHKLLGTLPMTACGCVIGIGAKVWPRADLYIFKNDGRPSDATPWTTDEESATAHIVLKENATGDTIAPEEWHADKVYASPEAAEAAKEATNG